VRSLAELNELLVSAMQRDDRRHIDHRRISVGEHFELEAPALRPLPLEPFDIATVSTHHVVEQLSQRPQHVMVVVEDLVVVAGGPTWRRTNTVPGSLTMTSHRSVQ
jgi:hypothetical protein